MEFAEPEDDPGSYRSPLPPEDRLWRHPSEMGAQTPARPSRRSRWLVVGVSAVGAGMLSTGLVVIAVTLLTGPDRALSGRPMEAMPLTTTVSVDAGVVAMAERALPAIVRLELDGGGVGSGVIFRSDGHVLTSAAVVDGAGALRAVLADGRKLPARVVGADPDTDTAVVKIDGGTFPVATMGTAADLEVGHRAVAVGADLVGGGPAVAVGVVSALHRSVRARSGPRTLHDMVQIDTAVVPTSSGGALLDGGGSLVGITTSAATGGSPAGSGFAVPIDVARPVADRLMASGRMADVWIGIQGHDLDRVSAATMDLDGGAMVVDVKGGSPAERAGMAASDVIVAVDGRPVVSMGQVVVALRLSHPGKSVTLGVMRQHQRHTMTVTVAERPPDAQAPGRS